MRFKGFPLNPKPNTVYKSYCVVVTKNTPSPDGSVTSTYETTCQIQEETQVQVPVPAPVAPVPAPSIEVIIPGPAPAPGSIVTDRPYEKNR